MKASNYQLWLRFKVNLIMFTPVIYHFKKLNYEEKVAGNNEVTL